MSLFKNVYQGKNVLITGNTGFKGSWLTVWLLEMGANVYGLSNKIPTTPSNFEASHLEEKINYFECDIFDYNSVFSVFEKIRPDFVFHLAAQAIVKDSYANPKEAFETNVIGTLNILESLRVLNSKTTAIIITSDKCYDNVEWVWGYKETDALGGKDPYSASKGGAELVVKTYSESYFKHPHSNVKIASARAGNVIGGGDWASHRIIPDAVRAWNLNKELVIRSPFSTRPWQHVLEPLSGYLLLGQRLYEDSKLNGEAFNFGPKPDTNYSVDHLLHEMSKNWNGVKWESLKVNNFIKEAGLLKLNCDKALFYLSWVPNLDFSQTVKIVAEWYKTYYSATETNMYETTRIQINEYIDLAKSNKLIWAI